MLHPMVEEQLDIEILWKLDMVSLSIEDADLQTWRGAILCDALVRICVALDCMHKRANHAREASLLKLGGTLSHW